MNTIEGTHTIARRGYRVSEVAEMLGRNTLAVYRKLYRGELKVCKGAGRITIPASEVDKLFNDTERYSPVRRPRKTKEAAAMALN